MPVKSRDYTQYFRPDHLVTVGIQFSDNSFVEDSATILSINNDLLLLEMYGKGLPSHLISTKGLEVVVTSMEGWALYRCEAILEEPVTGRTISLRLLEDVEVKQRREYFRMDVMLPIAYALPSDQQRSTLFEEWETRKRLSQNGLPPELVQLEEGFKVINWEGHAQIDPLRVNLSGGGLRFKVRDSLTFGAMLLLDIFLPTPPLRVIHAVGSVIRSKELKLSVDRNRYYSTAMAFKFIENRDREAIISYIFNEQRNSLRWENRR
jgi:hypothetical protein